MPRRRSRRRAELRAGLARTRRYLLSHHEPGEYYRCHSLSLGGRTVHVCARCSGVYPGILAGVALVLTGTGPAAWPWLVAAGPAPALVDWAVTTFTRRRGSNALRTASGALLGLGYGVAVPWFLTDRPLWLLGVAAVYGGVAAALLVRSRGRADSSDSGDGEGPGDGHENSSHGA
ncbi:DUF2085 domain-containing protein [Halosimplex amylolyticum]|uniref:DUF2085 domain-containing protein n=1 Tax=Halosimplex amylolyticum TaxID=3396616 RepID=UPI003F5742E6